MTREITIRAQWTGSAQRPVAFGTSGYSWTDLIEIGLRVGLLREEPPEQFQGIAMRSMIDTMDPLEELAGSVVPEAAVEPIARLLLVEALVGSGRARAIDRLTMGPRVGGARRVSLTYVEESNASGDSGRREIEGARAWE